MQAAKTEIPVKLGEVVMRLASLIASAAGILVLLSASGVSAQSAAEEPRSGWYVGGERHRAPTRWDNADAYLGSSSAAGLTPTRSPVTPTG